jgi:hypothetical protein
MQDLRYPDARFNEKGCLQVCGGDALRPAAAIYPFNKDHRGPSTPYYFDRNSS